MERVKQWLVVITLGFLGLTVLSSCYDKDAEEIGPSGVVFFELTDAPIDEASIKSCFVTLSEVKLDGIPLAGFEGRKTVDLLAYQNGKTLALGSMELNPGVYQNLELTFDFQTDDSGSYPGTYLLTETGEKLALSDRNSASFTIRRPIQVIGGTYDTWVIDLDLRKLIKYDEESAHQYQLVTDKEVEAGIRLFPKKETGRLGGKVTDKLNFIDDLAVIYAYESGTFDFSQETFGQGESIVPFANAVTSARIDENGNFVFPYLKAGQYEFHIANYSDKYTERLELDGILEAKPDSEMISNLKAVDIAAGSKNRLNIEITGILTL